MSPHQRAENKRSWARLVQNAEWAGGRPGMLWKTTLSVAPQSQSLYNCDSFY